MDRKVLLLQIAELERSIQRWGARNSQSNPGAVMELRAMKKELAALQDLLSKVNHVVSKEGDTQ